MQQMLPTNNQINVNMIIELLNIALKQHTNQSQKRVYEQLYKVQQNQQVYYYLIYIFKSAQYQFGLRQMSGLTLKSLISKNKVILSKQCMNMIKQLILEIKEQNNKLITIKDMIISELVNINKGKEVDLEILLYLVRNRSINTILVILEDLRYHTQNYEIWADCEFINFMQTLIKFLGQLFMCNEQINAMKCMNLLIFPLPQNLLHYLRSYVDQVLANGIKSNNKQIVLLSMEGLSAVAESKRNFISKQLIVYLSQMQNNNEQIKRVQANLWIEIIDGDEEDMLEDILQVLIIKFIRMLQFTQEDYHNVKDDLQNNWYSDINSQEIDNNQDNEQIIKRGGNFTIRKSSVLCIQKLSLKYSETLWLKSQNILGQAITNQNWKLRESGVLFIGIIAPQSLEQIAPFANNLIKILFQIFNNNSPPMLIATNLWTLQKLSQMTFVHPLFGSIFQITIQCCQTNIDSIVTQAALSLLDQYITQTKQNLSIDHLNAILMIVVQYIQTKSSGKQLLSAFRVLSQILQQCTVLLKDDQCSQVFKILLNKWESNQNNDNIVCPILQCLVTGCQKKKQVFKNYCQIAFVNCISVFPLQNTRKSLVLRSIDLCSSMLSLQCDPISQYLQQNQNVIGSCLSLLNSQHQQIKNFAFGLISDVIKAVPIQFNFQQLISTVALRIDKNHLTNVNNGLLCLTDILCLNQQLAQQFIWEILDMAVYHLAKPNLERIFGMNMSKVVGRLCCISKASNKCFQKTKPVWKNVCLGLRTNQTSIYTDSAFEGIFKICLDHLTTIGYDFQYVIDSFINYPCNQLNTTLAFQQLLKKFRNLLSIDQWNQFINRPIFLPGTIRKIQTILKS